MVKISFTPSLKSKGVKIWATQISLTTENNCYERKLGSANLPSKYGWGVAKVDRLVYVIYTSLYPNVIKSGVYFKMSK